MVSKHLLWGLIGVTIVLVVVLLLLVFMNGGYLRTSVSVPSPSGPDLPRLTLGPFSPSLEPFSPFIVPEIGVRDRRGVLGACTITREPAGVKSCRNDSWRSLCELEKSILQARWEIAHENEEPPSIFRFDFDEGSSCEGGYQDLGSEGIRL